MRINAGVDMTTGLASWQFTSLDPASMLPTTDPLAGFLAPGADGSVMFTVLPAANTSTGTVVENAATITFDANAPINTPLWTNTFDNTAPVSHVLALPATLTSDSFLVQWTGTDAGSGIQDFTIYVSDNGGGFNALLSNATATSATFTGQLGHTYAFYSTARDLVGNVETGKTSPEATTTINANTRPPVTTATAVGPIGRNGWYRGPVLVTLTATDPDSPVAATFYKIDDGAIQNYSAPVTVQGDGVHEFAFSSIDPVGNQEQWKTLQIKTDAIGPTITASASAPTLWPPNGKLVSDTISGRVADALSGLDTSSLSFRVLDEYRQVQPNGPIALGPGGGYSFSIALEARRLGQDVDGRRYEIVINATDNAGNDASMSVVIVVPHDQGK